MAPVELSDVVVGRAVGRANPEELVTFVSGSWARWDVAIPVLAVRRAIEANVLARFLECGDLHRGFARIRCGGCGHDLLLAFSCKTRYFCPSCQQKRVLLYGEWVEEHVLAPVPHRRYVFTVPRLLSFFRVGPR